MRVDSHQHFWDLSRFEYPWMPEGPGPLRRNFLPEHLAPILSRNRFDGSVAVQATSDPQEADWLLELAAENSFILGVVGWVDLTDERCGETLDRLRKHPKFKGVRHLVHDEPDDRWLLRQDVLRGLKELERRKIPYDLLLRPRHLAIVEELVSRVPNLPLVIDHIAKPLIASGVREPWASDIERIAAIPHVHVKLSGMITEARHREWTSQQLEPYVRHGWSLFGPDRCLFGSDWPVCLLSGSWKEVLAGCTQALGPLTMNVRAGVMGENAARFYGLQPPDSGS